MNKVGGLFIALLCLASCGGPQKPGGGGGSDGSSGSSGGGGVAFQSGGPVTPENVCTRIMQLKSDESCNMVSSYTLTEEECREEWHRSLEDRGPESRQANTSLARCLLDNESCDAVSSCVTGLNEYADDQDGTPTQYRTCEQTDVYAAVGLPRAEWEQRYGANATRYSEVPSTKDQPIEVCGIPAQMEWLLTAACNDGSRPFSDYDHAHASRVKNVGAAGRCGSIVDLYEVPCPEGTYAIYIDAYVCAQD